MTKYVIIDGQEYAIQISARKVVGTAEVGPLSEEETETLWNTLEAQTIENTIDDLFASKRGKKHPLTKDQLKEELQSGKTLDELFDFGSGQECDIFKADAFKPGNEIIYIPDLALNEVPTDRDLSCEVETIHEVVGKCYTGDDFMDMCRDRFGEPWAEQKARELFAYVDWQHPSSALDCGELDDEEE